MSDDQIVKIKFEYDLSTIEQKIQELQDTAEATGDNSDWAAVTVAQKQAIKMLLDETGLSADNNKGVKFSDDKVKELRSQMNGASEEERATAVIDRDYAYADNEGHIFLAIKNTSNETMFIDENEKIVQAVFVKFGIADEEEVTTERTGGIGSTGK